MEGEIGRGEKSPIRPHLRQFDFKIGAGLSAFSRSNFFAGIF
jgi:hypothetical protein